MKVAIHQPHYFPWLGYFDKMAKVDKFILMDDVQLTDKSNMFRNLFLSKSGIPKYLTIPFEKKGYMDKEFHQLKINQNVKWQDDHRNFIKDNYRKAPFFNEIWENISFIFEKKYEFLIEVVIDSMVVVKEMLNINTPLIFQSKLGLEPGLKKNDLVLSLCLKVNSNIYLSGNGAKKYMNDDVYKQNGVDVIYQEFIYPSYRQINSHEFVPNLTSIDVLFNIGIEESRKIFWNNIIECDEIPLEGKL